MNNPNKGFQPHTPNREHGNYDRAVGGELFFSITRGHSRFRGGASPFFVFCLNEIAFGGCEVIGGFMRVPPPAGFHRVRGGQICAHPPNQSRVFLFLLLGYRGVKLDLVLPPTTGASAVHFPKDNRTTPTTEVRWDGGRALVVLLMGGGGLNGFNTSWGSVSKPKKSPA